MSDSFISQICNGKRDDRDLLVDELNDEFEAGSLSDADTLLITNKLLELLINEKDQSVQESILNLLSGIYPTGIATKEIERYVLNSVHELQPGSLVHAFSILSESELDEKKEIFSSCLESGNKVVQKMAESYLQNM